MKIANISATTLNIHDALPKGEVQQYQDGVKDLTIGPAGSTRVVVRAGVNTTIPNDYRIIPNLEGGNSISVRALKDAGKVTTDRRVEPDGTDANPENEVNGPIVGLPLTVA